MADNYLEKRMADYRAGRLASTSRAYKKSQKALTVFVPKADSHGSESVVASLSGLGFRVLFTVDDEANGPKLAQKYGARYYPLSYAEIAEDVKKRGETIDAVIISSESDRPLGSKICSEMGIGRLVLILDGQDVAD